MRDMASPYALRFPIFPANRWMSTFNCHRLIRVRRSMSMATRWTY